MSKVYFTSDTHIGHKLASDIRGFSSLKEHDDAVIDSFRELNKRDKLYHLGDVVFGRKNLERIHEFPCSVVLVMGNHDYFKAADYLENGISDILGSVKYKRFWLSHIPVHPQEMFRCIGNIHGHIHKNASTRPHNDPDYTEILDMPPYYNVNWDWHRGPVAFEEIEAAFGFRMI